MDFKNYKGPGFIIEEHGDPRKMSRRELLGQGFISGSGMILAPSLISTLMAKQAYACGDVEQTTGDVPVMIMDLKGGGNLVGPNIVPGTEGGPDDPVGDLGKLGISGSIVPVKKFGLTWHQESMILRGLDAAIPADAKDKVKGIVFASKSLDDNDTNLINPAHALLKAGLSGRLVPFVGGAGNREGTSKSKLPPSSVVDGVTPVVMTKSEDARSLVKKHALAEQLSPEALDKILKAAAGMSESALCEFNKKSLTEQLQAVCGCKHEKSLSVMTEFSEANITPSLDENIRTIFGGKGDGENGKIATYAKLLANNYAGVGIIEQGGFDYHNGTRSLGDAKDLMLGDQIGSMIAYAHAIKKPIAIVVITDGAVVSNGASEAGYNGNLQSELNKPNHNRGDLIPLIQNEQIGSKLAWRSDASGVRGAAVMFVYHPNGVKQVRSSQVGAFEDSGIVKQVNAISGNLQNLVAAITANWLALKGQQGDIKKIMTEDISKSLDEYIVFDKVT